MDEPEVKERIRKQMEGQGYRLKTEPPVLDTDREVILDFYAWREGDTPDVVWIECKGDVNVSELLEGWVRTAFATYQGGGRGMLVAPAKSIARLERYGDFLKGAPHVALVGV